MFSESTTVKIDLSDDLKTLTVVFDRKCDHFLCPWQDAFELARVLKLAIADASKVDPPDSIKLSQECDQVRLKALTAGRACGLVVLVFEWTDRLHFSWRSAGIFCEALRLKADDARLACKGVHLVYNSEGMIKELHDLRNNTVQLVPGR